MEINTLRSMTTELCGRSINPAIEAHLTQYAQEVTGVLAAAGCPRMVPQSNH